MVAADPAPAPTRLGWGDLAVTALAAGLVHADLFGPEALVRAAERAGDRNAERPLATVDAGTALVATLE